MWTDAEIEHVRQLLPKIANGRKTRYQNFVNKKKPGEGACAPKQEKEEVKTKPPKANG